MQYLKADTAATVLLGPFLDATDGVTPETGLTAGGVDELVCYKHDGTAAVDLSGLTFTHRAGGMYTLAITTGHVDTEGRFSVYVRDDDTCLPVWQDFMVVAANVYDSLFAASGTDVLDVNLTQWIGTAPSALVSGDVPAIVNDFDSAAADLVEEYCDNALVAQKLDHLVAVADADDVVNDSIIAKLAASDGDWSGYSNTTDSLEAMSDKVALEATVGALNNLSSADVNAACDTALSDYDAPTKAEMDSAFAALNDLTQTEVGAAVWGRLMSVDGDVAGTYGSIFEGRENGTAQDPSGDASIIILRAGASAVDDYYNGMKVHIYSGTGKGQAREIVDYVGSTKTASVKPSFATATTTSSLYMIHPGGVAKSSVTETLQTDTVPELSGVTSATDTIGNMLQLLHMWIRNNTSTTGSGGTPASSRRVRNSAGTTIATASITEDANETQQGKLA